MPRDDDTVCTVEVRPNAQCPLAALMIQLRDRLAEQDGIDPELVLIGPVDFGTPG